MSLVELFCAVDDFCQQHGSAKRKGRQTGLCESEMMTIVIWFHQSGYRTFKAYYTREVETHLHAAFPKLVSYSRFIWLIPRVRRTLAAFLESRQGVCDGISLLDSTPLRVCNNRRITRHRVFAGSAQRGKSSMGWFYGFKLHLVVNTQGDILSYCCTAGNRDDRQPAPDLLSGVFGKVLADKGYVSQSLANRLAQQGIQLVTDKRANMHSPPLDPADKALLRRRFLIETIFDQLKNDFHLDHTRHRSPDHFMLNLTAALCAYAFQPTKPAFRSAA